jgi:hypothetical protein
MEAGTSRPGAEAQEWGRLARDGLFVVANARLVAALAALAPAQVRLRV